MYLDNTRSIVKPAKAAPRAAAAEHASTTRIECGGWASLPAEDSCLSLYPHLRDTWRLLTPRVVCWFYRSNPYGGSEASAVSSELPFLRDTWRLRTRPQAGSGSGAVGTVR